MQLMMSVKDDASPPCLQAMKCELGLLSRPDGSCDMCQGDTAVIAAVYGPGDVKMNRELIDRATIDVVYKPKVGMPGCAEKVDERLIRNTCETAIIGALHPRTAINVIIQEVQNSGSYLSCCINATCMALLDAAIPMKYMVSAITCILDKDGELVLNPTNKQEENAKAMLTFAFDSTTQGVLSCSSKGSFTTEQFQKCLLASKEASKNVFNFYRETLKKKLSKG